MRHPQETAGTDFTALALIGLVWLAPLYVIREGYDQPASGFLFMSACAGLCLLMHVHGRCGEVVRPVIVVTIYMAAFGSVLAVIAAVCLAPVGIMTLAAEPGLFHPGGDGGTLWLVYLVPAALLIVPITKWMDQ